MNSPPHKPPMVTPLQFAFLTVLSEGPLTGKQMRAELLTNVRSGRHRLALLSIVNTCKRTTYDANAAHGTEGSISPTGESFSAVLNLWRIGAHPMHTPPALFQGSVDNRRAADTKTKDQHGEILGRYRRHFLAILSTTPQHPVAQRNPDSVYSRVCPTVSYRDPRQGDDPQL